MSAMVITHSHRSPSMLLQDKEKCPVGMRGDSEDKTVPEVISVLPSSSSSPAQVAVKLGWYLPTHVQEHTISIFMRVVGRRDLQERTWAGIFSTINECWIFGVGKIGMRN